MGNERRIWPHNATNTVTVRATTEQYFDWWFAAREAGLKSAGLFLARCADRQVAAMKKEREGRK